MLIMRDNAPDRLKGRAKQFIEAVAVHDATVQAVLDDPVIRLMVLVDTVRSRTRLQNTRIDWVQPDTQITVTLQIGGGGDGLYDGLLHELILHVVPAALKHAAAIAVGTAPAYPTTDALIEAEEAQEHGSRPAWRRMADLAVALGIGGCWMRWSWTRAGTERRSRGCGRPPAGAGEYRPGGRGRIPGDHQRVAVVRPFACPGPHRHALLRVPGRTAPAGPDLLPRRPLKPVGLVSADRARSGGPRRLELPAPAPAQTGRARSSRSARPVRLSAYTSKVSAPVGGSPTGRWT
ncbi:hypothetical protein ACFQ60_45485 [Streptomyces zhihengii]